MLGFLRRAPAFLVVGVLLLVVGICVSDQTLLPLHLEISEACCAFTQCPVLPIALLGFALWLAGAYLGPAKIPLIRSTVQDPLSPPPELILFGSA